MSRQLRYLSVCSGIEAASVAWEPLGWVPVGFSETAPAPCSVLQHHFPHVPNFGDMNNYADWEINAPIDLLVGGTPCQSFSVAGLRGGLEDARGNLALIYCRILQKFKPRWFVWENVPGVFSSWSGDTPDSLGVSAGPGRTMDLEETSDFSSILEAFSELGYGFAWRVLDAQYFGVPQRRRRVFVVGCLGDWTSAARVLFEPGCVRGNSAKSKRKKKDCTGSLTSRPSGGGGLGTDFELDGGLVTSPITGRPYGDRGAGENRLVASTGRLSHCLNAGGMGRQDFETETMVVSSFRIAGDGYIYDEAGKVAPLTTGTDSSASVIAFSGRMRGDDGRGYDREPNITGNVAPTVDTAKPGNVAGPSIGVRRLTPRECERLQGFPDDWTLVRHRGKLTKKGPRYKMIGNSMAVPVMHWIGKRIQEVEG